MKFVLAVLISTSAFAQSQRFPIEKTIPLDSGAASKGMFLSLALKQEPIQKPGMAEVQVAGLLTCRRYEFNEPAYRCFLEKGGWQSDAETIKSVFGYYELTNKADSKRLYEALGEAPVHKTVEHSGEDDSTLQIFSKTFETCSFEKEYISSVRVTYVQVENYGEFSHDGYFVEARHFVPTSKELCPQ